MLNINRIHSRHNYSGMYNYKNASMNPYMCLGIPLYKYYNNGICMCYCTIVCNLRHIAYSNYFQHSPIELQLL